jgi:mycothiol synthase
MSPAMRKPTQSRQSLRTPTGPIAVEYTSAMATGAHGPNPSLPALERARDIALPDGYRWDVFDLGQLDAVFHVLVTCGRLSFGSDAWTLDELRSGWTEPGVSPESDAILVRTDDGAVIGFEEMYNQSSHLSLLSLGNQVLPEHRGRGIEDALLHWAARRAEAECTLAPSGAPVLWRLPCEVNDRASIELAERHGFDPVRYYFVMSIELDGDHPAPAWPDGIEIRSLRRGEDEELFYRVRWEAFQDHWGVSPPFEEGFARFVHEIGQHPDFDPRLFWGVFAENRLVAICHCLPSYETESDTGWICDIGVLRDWRERGLGRALLLHAFSEFKQLGKRIARLHVDAENPTGAVRLYENVGMNVTERIVTMGRKLTGTGSPA